LLAGVRAVSRRAALTGAASAAAGLCLTACGQSAGTSTTVSGRAKAASKLERVDLGFCAAPICILPFEVAKSRGFFEKQGLDVNLLYMGPQPAFEALLEGKNDFAAVPMDHVIRAVAADRPVISVAATGQVPFLALVAGPRATGVNRLQDLVGKKVGAGIIPGFDYALARYAMVRQGMNPDTVEFVLLSINGAIEPLISGQVDASMVQEPFVTRLLQAGGRVLVNFMDPAELTRYIGGPTANMGLHTRLDVLQKRPETVRRMVRAVAEGNRWVRDTAGATVVDAVPLVFREEAQVFAELLDRSRLDLYPADGRIAEAGVQNLVEVLRGVGLIPAGAVLRPQDLFTNDYTGA
jgi:NitT/TauT family transport system substrate-binding protein